MKNAIAKYISTFFYLGYFPFAPGSIASALGGLCAGILFFHPIAYLLIVGLVIVAGFLTTGLVEKIAAEKDPHCIVIDEVAGALIAFFMLPLSWPVFWSTFFVFRAFDMCKIYPANVFEKRSGSVGVMMDDIVAGIYTNIIMQVALRLAGFV